MSIPLRLLILEDSFSDTELVLHALRQAGFEPDWVRVETESGFLAALDPALDLILADYKLPQFDGRRALDLLLERGPDVPFILVSGTIGEELAVEALKHGAADYLLKDRLARLGESVRRALDGRRVRAERRQAEEALRESEARFRRLAENAPDLIYRYEFSPRRGFTYVSPAATLLTGFTPEEHYADPDLGFKLVHPDDQALLAAGARGEIPSGQPLVLRWRRKDGAIIWTEQRNVPVFDDAGQLLALEGIARDITSRKQAEDQLRELEENYRTLAENSPDLIARFDTQRRHVYVNPAAARAGALSAGAYVGLTIAETGVPEPAAQVWDTRLQAVLSSGHMVEVVDTFTTPDGLRYFNTRLVPEFTPAGQVTTVLSIARDVTEREQAKLALQASERFTRATVDALSAHIAILDETGRIIAVNQAWRAFADANALPGSTLGAYEGQNYLTVCETAAGPNSEEAAPVATGIRVVIHGGRKEFLLEYPCHAPDAKRWFVVRVTRFPGDGPVRVVVAHEDITLRKLAEEALSESAARYRAVVRSATDAIISADSAGRIVGWNPGAERIFGYTESEAHDQPLTLFLPAELYAAHAAGVARVEQGGEKRLIGRTVAVEGRRKDGSAVAVELSLGEWQVTAGRFYTAIVRDITERRQAEEALRLQSTALNAAANAIVITDRAGAIEWVNPAFTALTGYTAAEVLGQNLRALVRSGHHPRLFYKDLWERILAGQIWQGELINRRKDGRLYTEEQTITPLKNSHGEISHFIAIKQDVTPRKQAEAGLQRQLQHLAALRAIDAAITGNLDLRQTLALVLRETLRQLTVDAASVLLLNPHLQMLEYAAGAGFHTSALQQTRLRLGEGWAGQAALERRLVLVPDLRERKTGFLHSPYFAAEKFVMYAAAPLIVKGQIKGVLEVFRRTPHALDTAEGDWQAFFETLAEQTAIAIEDAQLFEGLQQANQDLTLAYDATIEGWSRAMDLRDRETEGHTRRVTELTLRLARALGVDDTALVHIRRGALLHDIGKIGVPDAILHKPGPLTEAEWAVMRQHPQLAHDMLAPIAYLRPALEIPYGHHEHWDGHGYPRGLCGEAIPAGARLFAVVDVWDALTSDRPYRPAWAAAQAREYIQARAGTQFEPRVVAAFVRLIDSELPTGPGRLAAA